MEQRFARHVRASVAAAVVVAAAISWLQLGTCSYDSNHASNNSVSADNVRGSVLKSVPAKLQLREVPDRSPSVSGTVRDTKGRPRARATVCAACCYPECGIPGPAALWCATTGEHGEYALSSLAANRYRMSASAPGCRPATRPTGLNTPTLDLVSDQPRPGVDFVLDDGGAFVSGVVSDAMGGPIVGAALSAIGDHPLTSARTDREGHFELSVEPGQVTLHVSADGYAWTYENLRAPDTHAQITLQPAASIAGVVVSGLDQSNLAGVEVRATKRRSGPTTTPGGGSTRSRSDGSFTLSWLSAGTYEITAHAAGWFGGSADDVSLRVADSKSGIRVVVSPAVSVYADVVVAPAGRPCTTGTVSMWRAATAAASAPVGIGEAIRVDGRVVLEAVPPGEYRVDVRCENPRGAREQATLQVANQALHDVHWSVSATASIAGKVVDASGKPVPGRRVFAEPSDPSAREPSGRSAVSGETGLFTLTDLPEARYRVVLAGEDDVSSLVELTAEHPNLVTLVASRSGTIRVLVAADRSDTVAVYAFRGAEQWVAQARANAFEIGGLAEGSYRVVVTDNRNRPLEQDVALRAGDVEQRSVSLPAATGVLRGRLVAADGEPVRDAWVTVSPSGAAPFPRSENTVLSAADGRFELPRLRPDDNYDVNVAQDGEQVARAQGVRIDNELLLNW